LEAPGELKKYCGLGLIAGDFYLAHLGWCPGIKNKILALEKNEILFCHCGNVDRPERLMLIKKGMERQILHVISYL
jgi:hypothetical protein